MTGVQTCALPIFEGPKLRPEQAFALREAFSDSDLPMRVDAVALNDLPKGWEIRGWRV